jgi:hypothetical protein
VFTQADEDLILHLAGCSLARKPGKNNWVEEDAVGGLPEYICRIARAINRDDPSKSISDVIAIAVGRVKTWARGGGGVTAKTRAQAAKAVAQWEAKKKAAKLDNKVKASHTIVEATTGLTDSQLELAAKIPCTEKTNRSLLENVKLANQLKQEQKMLLSAIKDKPQLLALTRDHIGKDSK